MQLNSFMKEYYCIFTLFYTIALFCFLSHFCRRYTKSYSFICSLIVPVCEVSHLPVLGLSFINKGIADTWFNWKFWPFLNIVISEATIHTPYSSCMWWGCPTLTHISYCCSKLCDSSNWWLLARPRAKPPGPKLKKGMQMSTPHFWAPGAWAPKVKNKMASMGQK